MKDKNSGSARSDSARGFEHVASAIEIHAQRIIEARLAFAAHHRGEVENRRRRLRADRGEHCRALANVARHVAHARVRALDRQFEDDENLLRLGAVVTTDLGLSRALGRRLELVLNVENVGDARVETGRSTDGVVNVASPRLVWAGLRGHW